MSLFQCPLKRKVVDQLFFGVIVFGLAVLLIAILTYSYAGIFSRYMADDYCFSNQIKNYGVINGLKYFYQNISNRYGAYLFFSLTELLGTAVVQYIPGLMIVLLLLSLVLVFRSLFQITKLINSTAIAWLASALTVFLLLFQAPNLYQSLYWRSGMVSYFAPLPIFFFSLGILLMNLSNTGSPKIRWIWFLLIFVFTLFSGGMSETFAAFQTTFWILCLPASLYWRKKINFRYVLLLLSAAVLGSLVAMVIMVLAPGNQLRLSVLPQAESVFSILQYSFRYAIDFIYETLRGLPLPTLFSLLVSALLGYHLSHGRSDLFQNNKIPLMLLVIPVIAFLLIAAVCAPTVYGMLAFPEPRALLIARLVLILSLISWGGLLGLLSHRIADRIINICFASILLLGILWLYPIRGITQVWQQIPTWQARASAWDSRQEEIFKQKAEGLQKVNIKAMNSIAGIAELSSDEKFWVNQCAAGIYGLATIKVVDITP